MTAEGGLNRALELADTMGWYCVPLMPLTKALAISGPHDKLTCDPEGIEELWRAAAWAIQHDQAHPDRTHLEPNIGVVPGVSRLAILDADTPAQVDAWRTLGNQHGYDPGPPTVCTPGSQQATGEWKHQDGGHWHFLLPDDLDAELLAAAAIDLKVGGGDDRPSLITGRTTVTLPPSTREEGAYTETPGTEPRPLPDFLLNSLRAEMERQIARRTQKQQSGVRDERLWDWDQRIDPLDVLWDGCEQTGTDYGCPVYMHPAASSARSIIAHHPGCQHLPGAGDDQPPPITFFTSNVPEWVSAALATTGGGRSVSKLKLYAYKHFGGDLRLTRKMLGLSGQARSATRTRTTRTAPDMGWRTISRPLPAFISTATAAPATEPTPAAEPVIVQEGAPKPEPVPATPTLPPSPPSPAPECEEINAATVGGTWTPRDLSGEAIELVRSRAALCSPDIWSTIDQIERAAGAFAGRDDQPEQWSPRHRALRANRKNLLEVSHLTTSEVADRLGIAATRARALLRSLIPMLSAQGIEMRERPSYNPYQFKVDSCAAADTAWAIWNRNIHENAGAA